MCVHTCVCLSHVYINLYVSFIYEDIFTQFTENVYGRENMDVNKFVFILKNNIFFLHVKNLTFDPCFFHHAKQA